MKILKKSKIVILILLIGIITLIAIIYLKTIEDNKLNYILEKIDELIQETEEKENNSDIAVVDSEHMSTKIEIVSKESLLKIRDIAKIIIDSNEFETYDPNGEVIEFYFGEYVIVYQMGASIGVYDENGEFQMVKGKSPAGEKLAKEIFDLKKSVLENE